MNETTPQPRQCEVCGRRLAPNNKTGVCTGSGSTPACRSAYLKRQQRKSRAKPDGLLRFAADMGPRPSPDHSTDRLDNDGGYWCGRCPECLRNGWRLNVAWGTREQQQNNLSINVSVIARRIARNAVPQRPVKPTAPRHRRPRPPGQDVLF